MNHNLAMATERFVFVIMTGKVFASRRHRSQRGSCHVYLYLNYVHKHATAAVSIPMCIRL